MQQHARRRRSRTGPKARREAQAAAASRPYLGLRNPFRPIELFSEDQIDAIHDTSLRILEELGLRVLNDEARTILKRAGADVDESERQVRFERQMIEDCMTKVPPTVRLHSRNPLRNLEIGGNAVTFSTVGGPPNVSDLVGGRRPGAMSSFEDLLRLAQSYDVIHMLAPATEPLDVEPRFRHLRMTHSMSTLTDKLPFVYSRGRESVTDALEMVRIARGIDAAQFEREPSCYTVVNANSPLQLDIPMCKGIIDFARHRQLMILTPFTLAGAMAPITLPGALAQQNAEALAGIALAQLVRPGAPVAYGGFTSNVDMKSGAPAFGTPEYVQAAFASGQLTRRYGVPFRSSNVNTSNAPDAQAAYESQMAIWGAVMGGCHILLHGAGWLEGGLTASFEKFIIDVEMLQMMAKVMQPVPFDNDTLALEAIRDVGPGGHYFGTPHTLERYDTAFYAPLLSDWRNFESWAEDGALNATDRAHRIYKQTLAEFEPPALDPAIREELDAFVARRTAEGGADLEN